MDADDPATRLALGGAYAWSRDLDRGEAEARQGLALSPNSVELMILLASVQIYSGDPGGALVTIDGLMRLDPHYPEIALQFLADAHFSLGQYDQAIEALEPRLERNPRSATASVLLASCFGWLGRSEDGRRAWDQALKFNPDFSIERSRQVLPFRNPEDFERRVEGLRKAGVDV
jgi:tetratricopeptide (TPR) repeat protein